MNQDGLIINVEEARTLLGTYTILRLFCSQFKHSLGTAYITSDIFDEYKYSPPSRRSPPAPPSSSQAEDSDYEPDSNSADSSAFEIPLNTIIECLNIFGTAGPVSNGSNISGGANGKQRKWRRADDDSGNEAEDRRGPLDNYVWSRKDEKRTGMRMSFAGAGYPLTLLMFVVPELPVGCKLKTGL